MVVDVCVTHQLASSAVAAALWGTAVSSEAMICVEAGQVRPYRYGRVQPFPLSHETYGRAGPAAFALLHELAEFAASTGAVSKKT